MQLPDCLAERGFHAGEHRLCEAFLLEQFVSWGMVVYFAVDFPDKSGGKRRQYIRISYDLVGYIPLNELMKEETA